MNVTTATPAEIDAKLAELYATQNAAEARLTVILADIHNVAGDRGRKVRGRGTVYTLTDVDALVQARWIARSDSYHAESAARLVNRYDEVTLVKARAIGDAAPLHAEYHRRPWARFFLVTSSNGHIHSSMDCSTCKLRTQFAWLPDASGQTETEAIAERDKLDSAALLCTTCFPNAPVEWTTKPAETGVCPGSGTWNYPADTARSGFYSGNYGVCRHCDGRITISSTGKMRKHKNG